jgi:hypothetical protein
MITPQLTMPPWIMGHLFWILVWGYVLLTVVNQWPRPDVPWTSAVWKTFFVNVMNSLATKATHVIPGAGTGTVVTQASWTQTPTESIRTVTQERPTTPVQPPAQS